MQNIKFGKITGLFLCGFLPLTLFAITADATTINLNKGWNLVGTGIKILDIKKLIPSADIVWKYYEGEWKVSSPNGKYDKVIQDENKTTFKYLDAGDGFWIYVDKETVFNLEDINETNATWNLSCLNTVQEHSYIYGDDGYYKKGVAKSYTANNDTIIDNNTHLMWENDINISNNTTDWKGANEYCNNLVLEGYDDWRLPGIDELISIVNFGKSLHAPDPIFSHLSKSDYWSSTKKSSGSSYAWSISLSNSGDHFTSIKLYCMAMCVRGEKYDYEKYFTRDDDKKVVVDKISHLMWQDNEDAATTHLYWEDAVKYCNDLILSGYDDWRLPNQNELEGLVNRKTGNIYNAFSNTKDNYWSSTTNYTYTDYAWTVNFAKRGDYRSYKKAEDEEYVRCVRNDK